MLHSKVLIDDVVMRKQYLQYFSNQTKRSQQLTAVLVVLIVAGIGTYLLLGSHAATPYASITADSGTLTSGATKQTCAGSSNGSCVVFGGGSSVPKHIETWAYDDSSTSGGCNGGFGASASEVQQWLTYAETNCGPNATKALSDCHVGGVTYCEVIAYSETSFIYSNNPLRNACSDLSCYPEDFWLHQTGVTPSSSTRLSFTSSYDNPRTTDYYLNKKSTDVDQWFQNYARTKYPNYDGLFMDDSGGSISGLLGNSTQGATTSYEITSDAGLKAAYEQLAGYLTKANGTPYIQINNGDGDNPYSPSSLPLLNNPASVVGMTAEGSPWSNGNLIPNWRYENLLDKMAYMDHTANDFQVILSYDSSGSLQGRRVQAATDLLGYSPGHVVSWSDLEQNNNNLAVWPEEGIYPTNPVQSMGQPSGTGCFAGTGIECPTGGHNDIQVATGVYRREFGKCYKQGVAFGPCAVIVNNSGSTVTVSASWLTQSYGHQITMVGGDVQSGGTVNLTGASFSPGSTTIAAYDAAFLAP
jgi:hypothetical protein